MNLDYPPDHPGWLKILDDLALDDPPAAIAAAPAPVGWTALPPAFADVPLPAGVGCYYRGGAGCGWLKLNVAEWIYYRLIRCEGEYVRRTRA